MENVIIVSGIILIIIAIIRELTCWYFKFSLMVERLTEIRDTLRALLPKEGP